MKEKTDETGDVYEQIIITGGMVGSIGGQGHRVEQNVTGADGQAHAPPSAPNADLGALRQRLNQGFDDPGLDAFCLARFPDVYDKFGRGMRKDEKITLLLDQCRRRPTDLERLVAAIGGMAG